MPTRISTFALSGWKRISFLGVHDGLGREGRRRVLVLNRITCVGILSLLVYMTLEIVLVFYAVASMVAGVIGFLAIVLYLSHRRLYNAARHLALAVLFSSIMLFGITMGTDAGTHYLYIPVTIIPLIIFRNRRNAYGYALTFLSGYFILQHIGSICPPLMAFDDAALSFFFHTNLVLVFIVTFLLTFHFRLGSEESEGLLLRQNAVIAERNREITESIRYARRIQEALLPPDDLVKGTLPEHFILYLPKDIVSGDFYWVEAPPGLQLHRSPDFPGAASPLPSGEGSGGGAWAVFVAAVDCTGHGVPGAMVSVVGFNALNRIVREEKIGEPARILDRLAEIVDDTFGRSGDEVRDGMDIALCRLTGMPRAGGQESNRMVLEFAGANNSLWMVGRQKTEDGSKAGAGIQTSGYRLTELRADKQPIGKYGERKPFTGHRVELQPGDTFYIFTDGYADQFGGPQGKKFRRKQFMDLILGIQGRSMAEQKIELEKRFHAWKRDLEQVDDVCVIGVRV